MFASDDDNGKTPAISRVKIQRTASIAAAADPKHDCACRISRLINRLRHLDPVLYKSCEYFNICYLALSVQVLKLGNIFRKENFIERNSLESP